MARLKEFYKETVMPQLTQQFGYKSVMEVPRITKIVLNMGVGEAVGDKKLLDNAVSDMQKVSGQKPVITKSKKSIAVFKIREGYPIGCMVTLRRELMYEFLDRLVTIALPRMRLSRYPGKAFDGRVSTIWVLKSRSFSRKLITTKLTRCAGMNIRSRRPPRPTKRRCASGGVQIPVQELKTYG